MSCDCPYCGLYSQQAEKYSESFNKMMNDIRNKMSFQEELTDAATRELEEEVSHEVDGEEILSQLVDHYQLPYYISRAIELLCSNDKEDWEESVLFVQLQMDKE